MQPITKNPQAITQKHVPRVSIGMPVYNGEPFIRRALDSLLAQSFTDFELIISDNASSDETERICREYLQKDSRIKFFRQGTNCGAFSNFTYVLERATGKYFMWAAADDIWAPNFIQACANALDVTQELGLVMANWEIFGNLSGPFFKVTKFPSWSPLSDSNPINRLKYFLSLDFVTHKANFCYGLWRRELAHESQNKFCGTPERLIYCGLDIAILTYALGLRPFGFIPDTLFFKRYKYFALNTLPYKMLAFTMTTLRRPWTFLGRESSRTAALQEHKELIRQSLKGLGLNPIESEEVLAHIS